MANNPYENQVSFSSDTHQKANPPSQRGMEASETPIPNPDELSGDSKEYQFPSDAGTASPGEEYQGSDAYSDVPSSSTLVPSGISGLSSRFKRLGLLVFVIMIAVAVMHFISGRQASKTQAPSIEKNPVLIKPVDQQASAVPAASMAEKKDPMAVEISQLKQVYLSDQSQIQQLRRTMEHMEGALVHMQQALIQNRNQVQALTKQLAATQQTKAMPKQPVTPKILAPQFYMKAAVRGRAWIEDRQGHALTVKIGDRLPDYGTIKAINPPEGYIATSSGRTIEYAPSDN